MNAKKMPHEGSTQSNQIHYNEIGSQGNTPVYMTGRNHNQQENFNYIGWQELMAMVENPVDLRNEPNTRQAKNACPFILPSDAAFKTQVEVEKHGNYTLLIVDLDNGDFSLSAVVGKVKALGFESFAVYSTLSHRTSDPVKGYKGQRWRVLIELSEGIPTEMWKAFQGYLCQVLDGDSCANGTRQIAYLPAIGKGGYEYHIEPGQALKPNDTSHPFVLAAIIWDNEQKAEIAVMEAARPKPAARRDTAYTTGQISPVDAFNKQNAIENLLHEYDYKKRGRKWLHPKNTSGEPGAVITSKGRYFSYHGCDPLNDGHSHDAFDLYVDHRHGGDFTAALKAAGDTYRTSEGISITQHNQRVYMQAQSHTQEASVVAIEPGESALSLLKRFSLNGHSKEMRLKMQNDVFVLGKLAIRGQATVFFAPPNCGKTLITMRLLMDAVKAGVVDGEKCFYLNADDHQKGLLEKLELAEQHGFHMLAPGHKEFKSSDLAMILQALTAAGEAHGAVLILDTLKKFADLMDKQSQTVFLTVVRTFVSSGGTVIALAHTNKHRNGDGKLVHAGTADSVQDVDCCYMIDLLTDENGTRTVEFEATKVRGDNIPKVAYRYSKQEGQHYNDILNSVECVDDKALEAVKKQSNDQRQLEADGETIQAICEALGDKATGKGDLVKLVQKEFGIPRRPINQVLDRYTGTSPFNMMHKWELVNGDKNAKVYRVLRFGSKIPMEIADYEGVE